MLPTSGHSFPPEAISGARLFEDKIPNVITKNSPIAPINWEIIRISGAVEKNQIDICYKSQQHKKNVTLGSLTRRGTGSTYSKLSFVLAMLFAVAKPASLRVSHFRIKLCQSAALSLIFLALTDKTGFRDVALPRVFADRQ